MGSPWRCLAVVVLLLLGVNTVLAEQPSSVRKYIEAAYAKRWKSAAILYAYGMRHARADDFSCVDTEGDKVDMKQFYANWTKFMAQIVRAEWRGRVASFELLSDRKAKVIVGDRFDAVLRDPRYTSQAIDSTVSLSEDIWELRGGRWLQVSSRILKQDHSRTPYTQSGAGALGR